MTFQDLLVPSCALFLDFDGTLVDLAPEPGAVVVPQGLTDTLAALRDQLGGALALISGRPIEQIDAFLEPLRLPVAGVHGTERRSANGQLSLLNTPPLDLVERAARRLADAHPGLRVEIKRGSVALHFRQAPNLMERCHAVMRAAVEETPGLALQPGKMVFEAKPGGASKGASIEAFLGEPPFAGRTPLFVGDDITDEVGFSTVQRLRGLGIKVGEGPSVAWQRVASPAEFRTQLQEAVARQAAKVNA